MKSRERGAWRAMAAAALVAAAPAGRAAESARGEVALRVQNYKPAIDSEFGVAADPYARTFSDRAMWGVRVEPAMTWDAGFGTLIAGLGVGYLGVTGHGQYLDPSTGSWVESKDETALHLMPASLFATYRLDLLSMGTKIPIAPYVRGSLESYVWAATGTGHASRIGVTNGYGFTVGVALILDGIDPLLTRELNREFGVRRTYLAFDATRAFVDDFGSARSWDLSSEGWSFSGGLSVAF